MRRIKSIWNSIVAWIKSKTTSDVPDTKPPKEEPKPQPSPTPAPEPKPEEPVVTPPVEVPTKEEPKEIDPNDIETLEEWTLRCINVSQAFEGTIPWANPTGNFDGMGLTMGALGWTLFYGQQCTMVDKFIARHGESKLLQYMPKTGHEYITVIRTKDASQRVSKAKGWSKGEKVLEPYRNELIAFWTLPEMKQIQVEQAMLEQTPFARDQALKFCITGNYKYNFNIFAYFFDLKVLNGSMKGVSWTSAYQSCQGDWNAGVRKALQFLAAKPVNMYNRDDAEANFQLWRKLDLANIPEYQKALFVLGYERSMLAKYVFRLDTLNRRGTLAFQHGVVHGKKINLKDF